MLRLNALWDGLAEELQGWLEIQPRGMTLRAAAHLQQLAGFAESDPARRFVHRFTPPEPVQAWQGIEEDFDGWVTDYAEYLARLLYPSRVARRRRSGCQLWPLVKGALWRQLCPSRSRLLSPRPQVTGITTARPFRGSGSDRMLLLRTWCGRPLDILKDYLKEEPTWSSYLLTAVPTITDVCKEAVLTGWRPDQCNGSLVSMLCRAYDLTDDEIQLAASWQDGERLQVNARTRLVVHRDNQLDDQVHH